MASWQNTSLIMLRTMLNDAGCGESQYPNNRLEDLLITAAYVMRREIEFITSYSVDIESYTITPDPISTTEDGDDFISFMVLKAACIADEGNFRSSALLQGVVARCGPATIQTSNYGAYLKELLVSGPCKSFETLKDEYNFNYDGKGILRGVMGPFISNDFDPKSQMGRYGVGDLGNYHRDRGY